MSTPDTGVGPARPFRKPLSVAAGVLALLALGLAGYWVAHPQRLNPTGDAVTASARVGEPVLFGMFTGPNSGSIVLNSAVARVRPGSADAQVRVLLCRGMAAGVGALRQAAGSGCTTHLHGVRLTKGSEQRDELVVEVTAREAGTVTVDGLEVSYKAGLRRGKQASGVHARLDTTDK